MKYYHRFSNSKYSPSKNTTFYMTSPFNTINKVTKWCNNV